MKLQPLPEMLLSQTLNRDQNDPRKIYDTMDCQATNSTSLSTFCKFLTLSNRNNRYKSYNCTLESVLLLMVRTISF